MKTLLPLILMALLLPVAGFAKPCGHISQLGHAIGCLRAHTKTTIQEGNGPHLVYVNASEDAQKGMEALINHYRGRDLTKAKKEKLLKLARQTEWYGLAVEMSDEVVFHYYLLNSGEEPVKVLSFDETATDSSFSSLLAEGKVAPFVLALRKGIIEEWMYDLFEDAIRYAREER